ncbi:MAG: condensation domain-containing protein [Rubripirellula sp.]|nr:condensation domain-containing protein [Rubripirellula sp.]
MIPLSFNQEGLWFLNQLFPDRAYGIPGCIRLDGKLDPEALRNSLEAIIGRHAILRTKMVSTGGRPFQSISDSNDISLDVVDLEALPVSSRMEQVIEIATLDGVEPFNLEKGPLIRAKLLRLSSEDHVFLINLHHIIADGWSMGVLMRELDHFYSHYSQNHPTTLKTLPIQYSDYSEWQRDRLQGERLDRELKFWEKYLERLSDVDALATDEVTNERGENTAGHCPITIWEQSSNAARELARQANVTFFVVLCSAYQCFLNFHARQPDVVIGSSFANRQQPDLEDMIGFFVNTLPLRTSFAGNPTMRELLRRTQRSVLAVHEHQELPLARIVQHLRPTRSSERNPLFQVVFDLLTPDRNPAVFGYGLGAQVAERRQIGNLTATPIKVDGSDARFDLAVFLWDSPSAMAGVFEYDANRFSLSSVKKWVWQFQSTLDLLVDSPDMKLQDLYERLGAKDRHYSYQNRDTYTNRARQKLTLAKRKAVPLTPTPGNKTTSEG